MTPFSPGSPTTNLNLVEFALGPCPADDMIAWTRTARRVVVEAKSDPDHGDGPSLDQLDAWSDLIDSWSRAGYEAEAEGHCFRWFQEMNADVGEFLLHGLELCLTSDQLDEWVTPSEASALQPTTVAVVKAFTNALWCEGAACQHYVDHILGLLPVDA